MTQPVSLLAAARSLEELWAPRVLAGVNDHLVKVARVQGEFPLHTHDTQDEMFLVLAGTMRISQAPHDGGTVDVHAGEFFVVPRGVRHSTSTPDGTEALIALIEPATTLHTGDERTPLTRSLADQMR